MQFYNFIFLARSWASDRLYLANRLAWLGRRAQEQDIPLTFILYPEGTLVSPNTRPISKKYADKMGIVSGCVKRRNDRPALDCVAVLTHNYLLGRFTSRIWHTPSCRDPRGYITACGPWLPGYRISRLLTLLWRIRVSARSDRSDRALTNMARPNRNPRIQVRTIILHPAVYFLRQDPSPRGSYAHPGVRRVTRGADRRHLGH